MPVGVVSNEVVAKLASERAFVEAFRRLRLGECLVDLDLDLALGLLVFPPAFKVQISLPGCYFIMTAVESLLFGRFLTS